MFSYTAEIFHKKLISFKRFIENSRVPTYINNWQRLFYHPTTPPKMVVYTCISGAYDIIPIFQKYINKSCEYICFTNNKTLLKLKHFGEWNIRKMEFCELSDTKNARWHKIHPHILFPGYEESIWIDANINICTDYLFKNIERLRQKDILIPKHFCRNDIYEEFDAVKTSGMDSEDVINKQLSYIKSAGMPHNYGLNETNIIYRKHHKDNIVKLMDEWWYFIENYSKRDQLSLSYILWENDILINDISIDNARTDTTNYKIYLHEQQGISSKILKKLFPYN